MNEKIYRFDCVGSTNDYAKSLRREGIRENAVILAKRQTGGRGTKGRSFCSETGGVYLTRLTYRDDFPAAEAFRVMADASVAVCKTLESFGFSPVIKWPNDVHVSGRKICGILVENALSGNRLSSSVVGIGLNVNNELPDELKEIAISMREAAGKAFDLDKVTDSLVRFTGERFPISDYIQRVGYLGRQVSLLVGDERIPAYAISVTERGELIAEIGGEKRTVRAAEVSLRI